MNRFSATISVWKKVSKFFGLDGEGWMRHANPWSGWTRLPCFALLVISFWGRVWLGWYSLVPIAIILLWTYLNPRIFPKPKSTDNWMSKGVLGERIWTNQGKIPIPKHHAMAPNLLSLIGLLGFLLTVWGVYRLDTILTLWGMSVAYLGKLWFVDRMVWLYEDVKHLPEFKSLLR
ncbi:MAG: DUF6653 family protein [Candidatus Fervidibacter sp.]|uniref:DUF6653 family protein n=1 Tax=Candidatus Fervidibacter sp. TaxID=3100871 RepID=UPI00404A53CD